jgi:hypothetical protein
LGVLGVVRKEQAHLETFLVKRPLDLRSKAYYSDILCSFTLDASSKAGFCMWNF